MNAGRRRRPGGRGLEPCDAAGHPRARRRPGGVRRGAPPPVGWAAQLPVHRPARSRRWTSARPTTRSRSARTCATPPAASGWPCSASPRPRAAACPISRPCRTRSSTRARSSIRVGTCNGSRWCPEVLKRGRQMGYSRSRIVDADEPTRVLALTEGQGISIGAPPSGLEQDGRSTPSRSSTRPTFRRSGRCSAAPATRRRPLGPGRPVRRVGVARRRPAPRPAVRDPRDRGAGPGRAVAGTDRLQGVSSHVMFLARGKVGPFRVEGEAIAGSGWHRRRAGPAARRGRR